MSKSDMNVGALVLLSGLDSTAALHWALGQYQDVRAVSFDYGQANGSQEIKAARACAKRLNVRWERYSLLVPGVKKRAAIPGTQGGISRANVPARNMIFLSTASGLAARYWPGGLAAIVIGNNADDAKAFPDCRGDFVAAADRALNLALDGVCRVAVISPWVHATKAQIVAWCAKGKLTMRDAMASVSCYAGTNCGSCDACSLRSSAFAANGVVQ